MQIFNRHTGTICAAVMLGLAATGSAKADVALPAPSCGLGPTNNCLIFNQFTVYSLALLNFQSGNGTISPGDPYYVPSNGSSIAADIVVASSDANDVPLTIALIDVDRFKGINDTFSHSLGDAVLRRVAAVIREHCRQDDLPVRYGGDEFLLVLAGADLAMGMRAMQRLKQASDACPWGRDTEGLNVTLSIGLATRLRGGTIAATISAADQALYEAKAGGRNRIASRV